MSSSSTWMSSSFKLPSTTDTPWYYTTRPSVIPGIDDKTLAIIAPVASYWVLAIFFHFLDTRSTRPPFSWLNIEKYRIHDSEEERAKNRATPGEVLRAVLFQQFLQTILAFWWVGEEPLSNESHSAERLREMSNLSLWLWRGARVALGGVTADRVLQSHGTMIVYWLYWWIIPCFQFLLAFFVLDTWQYFLHRLFHINKFLYKHVHSVHHRLYVPYAYGALYNHPVEGFVLDSLGAAMAESVAFMSVRQTCLMFGFSSAKTVDDHCGFSLPWDPLQFLYKNNARYHDVHHAVYGLKYNFSQPFFLHWDIIMGTRWDKPVRPLAAEKRGMSESASKSKPEEPGSDSDISSDSGVAIVNTKED